MFPDDEGLKWIAYDGASGVKPVSTFASYPVSGYYMMRNGWGQRGYDADPQEQQRSAELVPQSV